MIPFTFKDFKQLTNCLPSKGENIALTVNGQLIDRVSCTKGEDGWHIDLHPVEQNEECGPDKEDHEPDEEEVMMPWL